MECRSFHPLSIKFLTKNTLAIPAIRKAAITSFTRQFIYAALSAMTKHGRDVYKPVSRRGFTRCPFAWSSFDNL